MIWKRIYLAMMAGLWLIGSVQAQSPTPPWQQPPTSEAFNNWASQSNPATNSASLETPNSQQGNTCESGDTYGVCNGEGCTDNPIFGPFCGFTMPHDDWFRVEALLWWAKGGRTPPLLTTSPDGTSQAQAGVLGQPGTSVLLGNQELNKDFRAGCRTSLGTWLDASDNIGIEFTYLGLGQNVDRFTVTSTGSPILARPFFDVDSGAEDAHLIAYSNLLQGTFSCTSTSDFQAGEFLTRWVIARAPSYQVELLGGYRFQKLDEALDITDTSSSRSPGSTIQILDQFHTRNDFNGGELGVATKWRQCRWSLESNLKLAMGSTHSRVAINGSTTTAAATYTGGLLALPSNMGIHTADRFSVIPELGAMLGYDLTSRLRATLGYTFIYWSNVSRPGDQIDLNVSPSQFPPPTGASTKPAFVQRTADFWAQGINVGLDYRF
jgi:hypothetical protein